MSRISAAPALFCRTEGKGPLVIMLHGLLMDGQCWVDNDLVSAFSPYFKVVCPDLIGHGASERPDVEQLYRRENQVISIVKLMDKLGYEKAHVIGYSAGAWLAIGLIDAYPERLDSVVLGGWDCVDGLPDKLTFDMFMDYARQTAPELIASLTSADVRSTECFFNELSRPFKDDKNLVNRNTPQLLWAGTADPYYAPMAELAEHNAVPFISGTGDHLGEINNPDKATVAKLLQFIENPLCY